MKTGIRFIAVLCLMLTTAGLLTGCASPNTESELPWNTPQQWEGSPMIPGMDRQ